MKNKIKYLPIALLTLITATSGVALSSTRVMAATTSTKDAKVEVLPACTFTGGTYAFEMALTVEPTTSANTEKTAETEATDTRSFGVSCNNPSGFEIQAVGMSPDADHASGNEGNTAMYGSAGTIATGTTFSGNTSAWGMKITSASSSTTATITPNYSGKYGVVPSSASTVVTYAADGYNAVTGNIRTDYQVYVSGRQAPGEYTGIVKYTIALSS